MTLKYMLFIRTLGFSVFFHEPVFVRYTRNCCGNFRRCKKLVNEYENKYRGKDLAPFEFVDKYEFERSTPHQCPKAAAKKGIYVIFSGQDILYIGKSSARKKAIWHRIVDHFFSSKKSAWSRTPTHFVGWAVPDDSFFEASALEEFLIYKLRHDLPDNKVGKY